MTVSDVSVPASEFVTATHRSITFGDLLVTDSFWELFKGMYVVNEQLVIIFRFN